MTNTAGSGYLERAGGLSEPHFSVVHCSRGADLSGDSGRRSRWRFRVSAGLLVVAAAVMTGVVGEPGAAYATPQKASIVRTASEGTDLTALYVYSPAMRKTIKVQVLTPAHADRTRPSLYLLSGLGEEDPQNSMWLRKTDARRFYADKNVNVVMPLAGNGSLYTDWERDDPNSAATNGKHS